MNLAGVMPGALEYDDVITAPAMEGPAMNFMYQYTPQVGRGACLCS